MKLLKAKSMFLHEQVATANDTDGNPDVYECLMINLWTPAVRSKKTGKTFVMEWPDIIQKAIDAGVDTLEWEGADA